MEMVKSSEELDELRTKFYKSSFRNGYGIYEGFVLPTCYEKHREAIENFEVFDDDVWVTSFPKCGTTWLQETVWCIANNFDYEKAKIDIDLRFGFLEFCIVFDMPSSKIEADCILKSIEFAKNLTRPRFIKTHLPFDLLPKQIRNFERRPKIFHVARNPKDVAVSYFHHVRFLEHYAGDFETHWQLFYKNKLSWCPFVENVLSYWNRRNEENIQFVKFEDMKSNLGKVVETVASFLGVNLDGKNVDELLKHLSFEEMKNNPAVNHTFGVEFLIANDICLYKDGKFIREGGIGSYKSVLTPETSKLFDSWLIKLTEHGLEF